MNRCAHIYSYLFRQSGLIVRGLDHAHDLANSSRLVIDNDGRRIHQSIGSLHAAHLSPCMRLCMGACDHVCMTVCVNHVQESTTKIHTIKLNFNIRINLMSA